MTDNETTETRQPLDIVATPDPQPKPEPQESEEGNR